MEDATIAAEIIRLTAAVVFTVALPAPVLATAASPAAPADAPAASAAAASAAAVTGPAAVAPVNGAPSNRPPIERYEELSDDALTALAARWDALDKMERRALLTEMKLRMARNGQRGGMGQIHIRTERRYGKIIRDPDGRLIRIETQVVQVRPLTGGEPPRQAFGVGFERRIAGRADDDGAAADAGAVAASPAVPDEPIVILSEGAERRLEPVEPPRIEPRLPLFRVVDPAP